MFDIRDGFDGRPGTKESLGIAAGDLPTGQPYVIPVLVATGAEPGPTLLLHTGMHGDEVLGTEVVCAAWQGIDPLRLRGRVIVLPSTNLPGMSVRSRANLTEIYPGPQDMNRVFPGNPRGSLTERVAHILTTRFLAEADYCFDIHTPSVGGEWKPYVSIPVEGSVAPEILERTRAFAAAFGTTLAYAGDLFSGTIQDTARGLGKVVSTMEFGEANRTDPALLEWGVQGIRNLLVHLGMRDGEVVRPEEYFVFSRLHRIRAERGGFLRLEVRPGQDVVAGQRLAAVRDFLGDEREAITAPEAGRVVRVNNNALAGTGDLVVYVGAA